ncbi:MAG: DUF72 domain-containing protein [Nocardioidaceae bacterium]
MTTVRIGISGWTYPGWRGSFYPAGLAHRKELSYAAERFTSIEINGSFYSLQRPSSYRRWYDETPDDFVFSLKGGRFITHMKRLVDVETPVANFLASGVLALGHKLGPILWQLPPTLTFEAERLTTFLALLPRSTGAAADLAARHDDRIDADAAVTGVVDDRPLRHALEIRHPSLATPQAVAVLRDHDVALVVADSAGRFPAVEETTSDFVYVRLHGADELYVSGYTDVALARWADKVRRWSAEGLDVFIYFDNDAKVHAPYDAQSLIGLLES